MWILGGYPSYSDVWSSIDGVNWTEETSSTGWGGRYGHTSLVFDETDDGIDNPKIWVIGGFEFQADNDVWSSADGVNWTEITADASWSERAGHCSVVFDNKMWILGGQGNDWYYKDDVWSSTDGLNWNLETASPGWDDRLDHAVIVYDNEMWVISGDHYSDTEIWSSSDGSNWLPVNSNLDDDNGDWYNRSGHTSVGYKGNMWIMGGYGLGDYDEVWSSPNGINWIRVIENAQWDERSNHTSVIFDGKMWIIGGGGGNPTTGYSDVWYIE
jgi:hypothetical protein